MGASKASWILRQGMKARTRRWRRRQVAGFYVLFLVGLLVGLGDDHHGFHRFMITAQPLLVATLIALSRWPRSQRLIVTSLDDRAQLEHGLNFEQLPESQKAEILGRYRVGVFHVNSFADERQDAFRLRANELAFRFLRVALTALMVLYWIAYEWLPAGDTRDALFDAPVAVSWLIVFVISLPQVILMWTEPDEIGEPRLVAGMSRRPDDDAA